MMSLARLRQLEPKLANASDEEVADIRTRIYEIAQLAVDSYQDTKDSNCALGSKSIDGEV